MRVDLLVADASGILSVLAPLEGLQKADPGVSTRVLSSWEEFDSRIASRAFDVVVIQPDFPGGSRAGSPEVSRIKGAMDAVGPGGVILLFCGTRPDQCVLNGLRRVGCRFVLFQGIDDDPRSILRALARAATQRRIQTLTGEDKCPVDLAQSEFLLAPLVGWPASTSADALAEDFYVSARTLRRKMRDAGLLPPRQMIRWGCLLESIALYEMGVQRSGHLAALLGFCDPSAFRRLCRDLTGRSPQQILEGRGNEDPFNLLLGILKQA